MTLGFLFYLFLAFLLYKFVFGFVIPVYKTTQKVKRGFRDMQERMKQPGNHPEQPSSPKPDKKKDKVGDYIDFEEVKD